MPLSPDGIAMCQACGVETQAEGEGIHIRWLRPDYQSPEGRAAPDMGEQAALEIAATGKAEKAPWPKTLPEHIAALRNRHVSRQARRSLPACFPRALRFSESTNSHPDMPMEKLAAICNYNDETAMRAVQ